MLTYKDHVDFIVKLSNLCRDYDDDLISKKFLAADLDLIITHAQLANAEIREVMRDTSIS